MNQAEIQRIARGYLTPKTQTGPLVTGIISGLVLLMALGTLGSSTEAGLVFLLIGAGGLVATYFWYSSVKSSQVTDQQMDSLVRIVEQGVRGRALQALNLDPSEIASVDPLIVQGYNFENAGQVRMGRDRFWRSNVAEAAVIYFSDDVLHAYQEVINLTHWGTIAARTDTYFYSDIVSITTQTSARVVGGKNAPYHEFRMTTSGGTSISCGVVPGSDVDRSIQGARSLVMERKRGNS